MGFTQLTHYESLYQSFELLNSSQPPGFQQTVVWEVFVLKWELPKEFKTKRKKNETYQRLTIKRSSLTFFAVEENCAFITEQAQTLPGAILKSYQLQIS